MLMQLNSVSTVPLKARPLPIPDQVLGCIRQMADGWDWWSFPFSQPLWDPSAVLGSVLGSVQARHGCTEVTSVQVTTKMIKGPEHFSYKDRPRELRLFTWRWEGSGRLLAMRINTWGRRGVEKLEPDFHLWSPKKGQRAMGANWNTGNSI